MHTAFKQLYTCTYVKESWLCITTCVNNTWDKKLHDTKVFALHNEFHWYMFRLFSYRSTVSHLHSKRNFNSRLAVGTMLSTWFSHSPRFTIIWGVNEWYIAYTQNNYTNVFTFSTPSLSSTHLFDQAIRHFFCTHSTKHNSNLFVGEFNWTTHQYLQPHIRHRCTAMSLEYGSKIFTIHVHSSLEEESPRTKIHLLYCIKQFL